MKKHNYFKGVFLVLITMLILSITCVYGAEESVTVTTYYPSPYGVYSEMRLYPKNNPTACSGTQRGLMYYDATDNRLKVCNGTSPYSNIGGRYDANNWMTFTRLDAFHNPVGTSFVTPVPDDWTSATIQGWAQSLAQFFHWKVTWGHAQATGQSPAGPIFNVLAGADYTDPSAKYPVEWLSNSAGSRAWITTSGNVGIGTTNPQAKLHVVAPGVDGIMLQGGIGWGDAGWPKVSSALSPDQGGNVELGAIGPSVDPRWYSINPRPGGTPYIDMHYGNGLAEDYNVRIINSGNNILSLRTMSGGDVLAVNGSNVGIGTSGPWKKLDVQGGSIRTGGRIGTQNFDPDSGYPGGWGGGLHTWDVYAEGTVGCGYSGMLNAYMERNGSAYFASTLRVGSGLFISGQRPNFFLALQGDRNMVLYDNGIAVWNSGTWVSDIRLKRDVQPLGKTLDKIKGLNAVKFILTNDESNIPQLGLIAQEVEQVFPELVYTDKNSGYKLIYYDKLSAILLQAVKDLDKETADALKEQRNILEEQKKMIESLKEEVDAFKKQAAVE